MAGQHEEKNNNTEKENKIRQVFFQRMKQIYNDQTMTKAEYMEFYTLITDYCVRGKEVLLIHEKETHTDGYKIIFKNINDFLDKNLRRVSAETPESDQDETCLDYYCKVWTEFRWSSKVLNGVSAYLNKQYRKKCPDGETVEQIALRIFREHLFSHLNHKVSNAALRMLERNREGQWINTKPIKAVIDSYIELGTLGAPIDTENVTAHLTVYREFEKRVLEGSRDYYNKESVRSLEKYYIEQKSFVEYMQHAKKRIDDEMRERAKLLHVTTEELLLKVCSDALVEQYLEIFDTEFRTLLINDRIDDMGLMYSLASISSVVLKRLHGIFEEHVTKDGSDRIEKCAEEAVKSPKTYIETMLAVHDKYHNITCNQFKSDIGFGAALDKACEKFMNNNAVTGGSSKKSPEMLAAHCHKLLKKSSKNLEEAELEEALNKMLIVFKYIADKDVFEVYYKKRLADRLIEQASASDDAEASMISKMKHACGYNYTNKLQRMYQDIEISKDINSKFRQRISAVPLEVDFRIQILTHGSWPLNQGLNITVPNVLLKVMDCFTGYYKEQHTGRKLVWLHNFSKGELQMRTDKKRTYFVKANTYQISMLLLFNEKDSYTIQQIHEHTGLRKEYTTQMVQGLIRSKILKCSNKELTDDSIIEVNKNFNEPKIRFDISQRIKLEQAAEKTATDQGIEEDRKHLIEAAIVRVMKMRKTLNHQGLIAEVLSQLASKFNPKVTAIKKCIDILIEKEYLERNPEHKDTYNYLA